MTQSQPSVPTTEGFVVLATTTLEKALRRFDLTALWSDVTSPETSPVTPDEEAP